MTQPTNHWKLGLFVVSAFLLGLAALVYFGTASLNREAVEYRSYFDEAVTGLEIGSTVKFRGVTIGTVSAIDVAPDRRHVETVYKLGVKVLDQLGIAKHEGESTKISIPTDLRAQIGTMGITGQKYILLDFFEMKSNPPEKLPFPLPENHIPAANSLMKNLEASAMKAVDRFPELADETAKLLGTLNRVLIDIEQKQLPARADETLVTAQQTLKNADAMLQAITSKVNQVPAAQLSANAQQAIDNMNLTLTKLQGVIDRVDGDRGLVASMQRTSDTFGDVAASAEGVSGELSDTLRDVREAAISIRQVLDALERDSDMLIKGRAELEE